MAWPLARFTLPWRGRVGAEIRGNVKRNKQMDLGLKDRVAIVTGGNRGIGYAISAGLLNEGAHVVVASLDPARNAHAIDTLKAKSNGRAIGVPTDLNDVAAVDALFKTTLKEFGRLDILVNNATNVVQGSFFAMTEDNWDRAFDNKLRGTVRCIRHAVPFMRERKWGRIVNISGGAAWTPQLGAITTGINNAAVQSNDIGTDDRGLLYLIDRAGAGMHILEYTG